MIQRQGCEEVTLGRYSRRQFTWLGVFAFLGTSALATVKFFFPRVLYEPKNEFKIGYPADYGLGVDTKYQPSHRVWVVKEAARLYVILAKCTHLGCTPDWKEAEQKFKCPCHGSGFDKQGVNFEGPAPRPLDRVKVTLAPDGQIVADKGVLYPRPSWNDDDAFVAL